MFSVEEVSKSERARSAAPRLLSEYMLATGTETGAEWAREQQLPSVLKDECISVAEVYAPPGTFWVAFNRVDPVGCVGLKQTPERWEIRRLWVQPAQRGAGLGSQLVARCLNHAHACGANEVVLDVVPSRLQVIDWYCQMGFEETEPYEDSPFEMVYLRKAL